MTKTSQNISGKEIKDFANIILNATEEHLVQIVVTSKNGERKAYVMTQQIAISLAENVTSLSKMIHWDKKRWKHGKKNNSVKKNTKHS